MTHSTFGRCASHGVGTLALIATLGCFPTLQTARIDNGLHVDAGFTVLGDQTRNDRTQAADLIPWVGPVLGVARMIEIGIPVGFYVEGADDIGADDTELLIWPYLKFSLLEPGGRDHLALVLQSAFLFPANVGLRYGHELHGWEPHVGVSVVFSGGPAGDDPMVTRYQELGQSIVTVGVGATWLAEAAEPTVELGVMRNHYREGAVFGDFGQPTTPRTLYDLFVAARVRL